MDRALLTLPDTEGPPTLIRATKLTPEKRDHYKRLRAIYSCVCGAALVPVLPQSKAQGGVVYRPNHFRADQRNDHPFNCPWLQEELPRSKFEGTPNFEAAVAAGAYVVLNLNVAPRFPYRADRLDNLKLPADVHQTSSVLSRLNGRYVTLAVTSAKGFMNALNRVAQLTGRVNQVMVSHGNGIRPVFEMLDDESLGQGRALNLEALRLSLALKEAMDAADTKKERDRYAFATLFPRLLRIIPSKDQVLSQFLPSEKPFVPHVLPKIRARGHVVLIDEGAGLNLPGRIAIFQHSMHCINDQEQRRLLTHLAQGDPVYAVAIPRVRPHDVRTAGSKTFFDHAFEIIPGMTHIGPLPELVERALLSKPKSTAPKGQASLSF